MAINAERRASVIRHTRPTELKTRIKLSLAAYGAQVCRLMMARRRAAATAIGLALLRAAASFELTQVAEVLGGAAAASWAFQSFQDSQRKQVASAADAESKERLEERRQRAFIEPRETWRESELKQYDGTDYDGPILLGADGKVFNVWRGRHFYAPGGPYASMAGRDATRQLAKNRLDGDPDYEPDDGAPLNPAERASLALWVASFEGKYDVVGKLVDGD